MTEQPQASSLTNVFGLDNPQHMYTKMVAEQFAFQNASSIHERTKPYPERLFMAFNLAVTIWHMTDWLWMSGPTNRQLIARKFGFEYDELKKGGLDKGLKFFQDKARAECAELNVCEEIANASKHMIRRTTNPNIKALVEWEALDEDIREAKAGDLVMKLYICDGEKKTAADLVFIEAIDFWDKLMKEFKLFSNDYTLPKQVMKL